MPVIQNFFANPSITAPGFTELVYQLTDGATSLSLSDGVKTVQVPLYAPGTPGNMAVYITHSVTFTLTATLSAGGTETASITFTVSAEDNGTAVGTRGTTVSDGLAVEYLLREGSGLVAHDSSGNGLDATISAGALSEWVPQGYRIAERDDYILMPDTVLGNSDTNTIYEATVELWAKCDEPLNTNTIGDFLTFAGVTRFALSVLGPSLIAGSPVNFFKLLIGNLAVVVPQTGEWFHLVLTLGADQGRLYFDGVLGQKYETESVMDGNIATSSVTANLSPPGTPFSSLPLDPVHGPKSIGGSYQDTSGLHGNSTIGVYGECRVYNRALSEDEVRQNYEATAPLYRAPSLVYFKSDPNRHSSYAPGNHFNLSWEVAGSVTSVTLTDLLHTFSMAVPPVGTATITPTRTTWFELHATNEYGTSVFTCIPQITLDPLIDPDDVPESKFYGQALVGRNSPDAPDSQIIQSGVVYATQARTFSAVNIYLSAQAGSFGRFYPLPDTVSLTINVTVGGVTQTVTFSGNQYFASIAVPTTSVGADAPAVSWEIPTTPTFPAVTTLDGGFYQIQPVLSVRLADAVTAAPPYPSSDFFALLKDAGSAVGMPYRNVSTYATDIGEPFEGSPGSVLDRLYAAAVYYADEPEPFTHTNMIPISGVVQVNYGTPFPFSFDNLLRRRYFSFDPAYKVNTTTLPTLVTAINDVPSSPIDSQGILVFYSVTRLLYPSTRPVVPFCIMFDHISGLHLVKPNEANLANTPLSLIT
jgi:hypothetical protein